MFSKTFLKNLRNMVDELLDIEDQIKSAEPNTPKMELLVGCREQLSYTLAHIFDDY